MLNHTVPDKNTVMVVLLPGASCEKVMLPLMPLWLKMAVTVRAAVELDERRVKTRSKTKTRRMRTLCVSFDIAM